MQTALFQDICLTTKNCVCTVKDSKTTSKSINQIRPVLMRHEKYEVGGGGLKNQWFFPLKRSYELGMDVKRGEQEGVLEQLTKKL